MNQLFAVFKMVSMAAAGLVGATLFILASLSLVMPGSLPHRATEWLSIIVFVAGFILVAGACVVILHAGWREANAEQSLRPLPDPRQTRFLVDIPSFRRFGVFDIRADSVKGIVIGQNGDRALPLTPVSYDLEQMADARIPLPEPHRAGDILDAFFGAN